MAIYILVYLRSFDIYNFYFYIIQVLYLSNRTRNNV